VRKQWILSCLLSASALGCAGPSLSSAGNQVVGHPQVQQLSDLSGSPQQPSWTQKVTGIFSGKSANPLVGPATPKTKLPDPLELGVDSGPPGAELYIAMAKMSDQGGNSAQARNLYHRALTMQPKHLEGMLALARLEDRAGQLDAALHYYLQAVKMHSQSAKALNDLSLCFARRGQLQEALAPLQQAIRLQPGKQLYRNNIAKLLTELNQLDGALHHLSAVHAPAIAQYNMGYLLNERGRSQEAIRFLAGAVQVDPSLAAAHDLLAELSGPAQHMAQASPAPRAVVSNNHILPTPQTYPGQGYPATGTTPVAPSRQTVPSETARLPMGYSPVQLPPVR